MTTFTAEEQARARDALNPDLWPGDETPHWKDCARAFPEIAHKALDPSEKVYDWTEPTLKSADSHQSYASLFSREKGFWISCGLDYPCDQTVEPIREIAAFYPAQFPWVVAAKLRALSVQAGGIRYSAIKQWTIAAMEEATRQLPDNAAAKFFWDYAKKGDADSWMGWCRTADWRPDLAEGEMGAKQWGALEIHIDAWNFVENAEQRIAQNEHNPKKEEEPPMQELMGVFARALFSIIERDPLWTAGPAAIISDELECAPRWGEDDFPRCFLRRGEAAAAMESAELRHAMGESANSSENGVFLGKAKAKPRL